MSTMQKLTSGAKRLGLELSPAQIEQFETYYRELISWNEKVNLTSITDYDEVQVKHFLDSLTVVSGLKKPDLNGWRVIDVGTGGGMPGIPLKIVFPGIGLVLLEATGKKARFLEYLIGKLNLTETVVVNGRAEEVAHDSQYREQFNLVLSRAVAALPALVELTLPFCAVGGRLIAQKKGAIDQEVEQASRAISLLGGELEGVRTIDLEELADKRYLVVIDKIAPTPEKYPRRPGVPAKKPILH